MLVGARRAAAKHNRLRLVERHARTELLGRLAERQTVRVHDEVDRRHAVVAAEVEDAVRMDPDVRVLGAAPARDRAEAVALGARRLDQHWHPRVELLERRAVQVAEVRGGERQVGVDRAGRIVVLARRALKLPVVVGLIGREHRGDLIGEVRRQHRQILRPHVLEAVLGQIDVRVPVGMQRARHERLATVGQHVEHADLVQVPGRRALAVVAEERGIALRAPFSSPVSRG